MKEEKTVEQKFWRSLRMLAPGTPLREGLENILRAKTGALIVIGDSQEVLDLVDGGFRLDCELTPSNLYELAKMDGAIILSHDAKRILYANTQLIPDPTIPSTETGIRHRTAERVAKQTGEMVVTISQRRSFITLYRGYTKYVLKDLSVILTKANQALQTLEKYKSILDQGLVNLSALEFEELATVFDVVTVIQRVEMVLRIVDEIEKYIIELGTEGRLVSMQLKELVADVEEEEMQIIKDYYVHSDERSAEKVKAQISALDAEGLRDIALVTKLLGYGTGVGSLEQAVTPRGYRILNKIPRLPLQVIENMVATFGGLQKILDASLEDLDNVDGIGGVRARNIKEGLRKVRDQVLMDRHI